jgi:phenylpropionate dioxygenase-like ring-hydroxylating dioxygenase large terminal subunit
MNFQAAPTPRGGAEHALSAWFARWHPIARSRDLNRRPIARRVLDLELVLFRSQDGRIGAMANRCPHRGMRLSKGCVRAGRLVCPYHGWSYGSDGEARSPGNPSLRLTAPTFEVMERHGLVWVKQRGNEDVLPEWTQGGYEFLHSGCWHVKAPVEVMLDNFTEVEHTATAHRYFGYDQDRVADISIETRSSPLAIEARTEGRQKKLPWPIQAILRIRPGDLLCREWITEFAPLRCTLRSGWKDAQTRSERDNRFLAVAYFNPIGEDSCQLSTIYFYNCRISLPLTLPLTWAAIPLLRWGINNEVRIDINLVENVVPPPIGGARAHLGRFDKAILERLSGSATVFERRQITGSRAHLHPDGCR